MSRPSSLLPPFSYFHPPTSHHPLLPPLPLQVPLYPDASAAPSFTQTSGMVYFAPPARNGLSVDRWRVEWSVDSAFPVARTSHAVVHAPQTYYNITALTRGTQYYIRVVAHNSLGYGAPSLSYPFTPHQPAGAPYKPLLAAASQATDLQTYARSLNLTWGYPERIVAEGDLVGDGGLADVAGYVVEWARRPFAQFTPTVQNISIRCNNLTVAFHRFR